MMKHDTREKNSWWNSALLLLLLMILIVLVAISFVRLLKKNITTKNVRDDYQQELNEVQTKEQHLQAEIEFLKTDRGTESALRDQFPIATEGEEVIVIVDDHNDRE